MSTKPIEPAIDAKDFADPAADVNLLTERGLPSRRIRPLATGTLVVTLVGSRAADGPRTLAVTANVDEDVQATIIHATSAVAFRVYW